MREAWPWLTLVFLGAYHGINPGMGWLFAVALGLQERSRRAVVRAFAPIALGHAISIALVAAVVAGLQWMVSPALLRYGVAAVLVAFGLYKLLAPMSHPRWVGMRVGFCQLLLWSFLMATAHGAGLMLVPVLLRIPAVSASPAPLVRSAPNRARNVEAGRRSAGATDSMRGIAHARAAAGNDMAGMDHASMPHMSPGDMPHMDHADHAAHIGRIAAGAGSAGPLVALAAVLLHTLAMFVVMAAIALVVYEKIGLAILRRAWLNLDLLWAVALIVAGVLTLMV